MRRDWHTFVVWLKLGEFLLRSVEPISESGRPLPFVGEAVGVLFIRSGDTCEHCHEHALRRIRADCLSTYRFVARHGGGRDCCLCSAAICVVEECLRRMAQPTCEDAARIDNGCAN
jgi:hypothetical protein